ncbi:MAG TPA: PEP-CTERM sorting domain-containing protein [Fimbriimonadales bacterium]|jgi:hypothetical protein|nr:PEP-CTERM sorting domain-containing protein [Fimbriimonadales bacterium]
MKPIAIVVAIGALTMAAHAQQIFDPNLISLRHDFETDPPDAPPTGPFTLGNATFSEQSTGTGGPGWRLIELWPGFGRQLTDNAGITDMSIVFDEAMAAVGLDVGIGAAVYMVDFLHDDTVVGSVEISVGSVDAHDFAGWADDSGITSVHIVETSGENGLVGGIDNVRYDTVPEPATFIALGLGLAALASRRRR